MKPLALLRPQKAISFHVPSQPSPLLQSRRFHVYCSSLQSESDKAKNSSASRLEYKPGVLDDFFLNSFRSKLVQTYNLALRRGKMQGKILKLFSLGQVQEVGWDSEKPGYDGLIELANRLLMKSRSNTDAKDAAVRILKSLFPPFLLELYKLLIAPIAGGKVAALMVARVTVFTCQWLMGPCTVNSVDLPNGTSWESGVFVEKCKYLEESKCVGVCINTCKLPTQAFFTDYMGVPLAMEPNFSDYSCQFKFGVHPPLPEDDSTLKEPCLEICPIASRRNIDVQGNRSVMQCPKA